MRVRRRAVVGWSPGTFKEIRERLGSQARVAEMLHVAPLTVGRWENTESRQHMKMEHPRIVQLAMLALEAAIEDGPPGKRKKRGGAMERLLTAVWDELQEDEEVA
jgi:DNA-binding XRE family transcriptional regulator